MRKMVIVITLLAGLLFAPGVWAVTGNFGVDEAAQTAGLKKELAGATNLPTAYGNIIAVGLSLLGIVFFVLTLYAGVLWMTARGDTGKVDTAKNILESAIIGLVIIAASYAISNFIFSSVITGGTTETPAATSPAS